MARVVISVAVFLFLFTLSRARDIQYQFPDSKSASSAEIHDPDAATRSHSSEPKEHDTVSLTLDSVDPVPLTFLTFRPINRHAHPQHPLPFPLSIRRCRHGHRREIPYGNDMIVSRNDAAAADDRRIPARLARFHSAEQKFPEMMAEHDDVHHHHHRHHVHGKHHLHHHEKGWFGKRIGEFLNLF